MCHNVESWLNIYQVLGGGEKAYLAELDSLLLEQWDEG